MKVESNTIKVKILKKDFKSDYFSHTNCALARALKRMLFRNINVGGWTVDIGNDLFCLSNRGADLIGSGYTKVKKKKPFKSIEVVLKKTEL